MHTPVVLVTRRDDQFSAFLRNNDCRVLNLELIETEPMPDLSELSGRIERISEYDGLFITSPVAAEIFVEELTASRKIFEGRAYVVGGRAQSILKEASLDVAAVGEVNTAEELIRSFDVAEFNDKKFLFIRGNRSMRTIPDLLSSRALVDEVIVYRTCDVQPEEGELTDIREQLTDSRINLVCFFSPSAVQSFIRTVGTEYVTAAEAAAIGETTANFAREAGFSVDLVSPKPSAKEFARHLIEHLKTVD